MSQVADGETCAFHHTESEDVFGIGFHLLGGARFDIDGADFETMPLDVRAVAAPRGLESRFQLSERGFRTVALRFSPDAAEDLFVRHRAPALAVMARESAHGPVAERLLPLDQQGATIIESMFAAPADGGRTLFLESCVLRLLAFQLNAPGQTSMATPERGLTAAREHLDAHLGTPPSIVELARIAGINDFKLKREFKAAFGTTVYGYVRQRRMERAAADLHAGLAVAQAAAQAGYECPRCFADAFRRHYGVLPSEVTRAALKAPAYHG